jgi:hypothetical protein
MGIFLKRSNAWVASDLFKNSYCGRWFAAPPTRHPGRDPGSGSLGLGFRQQVIDDEGKNWSAGQDRNDDEEMGIKKTKI